MERRITNIIWAKTQIEKVISNNIDAADLYENINSLYHTIRKKDVAKAVSFVTVLSCGTFIDGRWVQFMMPSNDKCLDAFKSVKKILRRKGINHISFTFVDGFSE